MKVEIEGRIFHAVPNSGQGCSLRFDHCPDIRCFFDSREQCTSQKCSTPSVAYLDDEGFAKYIAARLTK